MATKDIQLAPLTGILDVRSTPDAMPPGSVRMRQNLQCVAENKLRRGTGWRKLLSKSGYNNSDYHDQLLIFHEGSIRQPITLISEQESTSGTRSLLIATQSRIARLSEHSGNWKILGMGYGGEASTSAAAPRFKCARVGDYVAFTNDFDPPMYHVLDQEGENGQSLYEFADAEEIGFTRAKHVWAWRNFIIFADVEMDGKRYAYRLISSDFDNPTSLDPARASSIAFQKDLMSHEKIIGGAPFGNAFLIYTTHGIWEMTIGTGDVLNFRRAYNAEDNELKGTLTLPNVLINTADGHLYGGKDGLYFFNQYMSRPDRPEWLHRSTPIIYDNIDLQACEVHVAGVYQDEILISVAESGQTNKLPNVTLRINWQYRVCDKLDYGFTAFGHYSSQDIQSLRDFIIENRICTLQGLTGLGYGYSNEGLPNPMTEGTSEFEPMSIHTGNPYEYGGTLTVASAGTGAANGTYVYNWTTGRYVKASNSYYIVTSTDGTTRTWKLYTNADSLLYTNTVTVAGTWATTNGGSNPKPEVTLSDDVVVSEDYEQLASDEDSLCALLDGEIIDAGCRGCKGDTLFVAASSGDWCLKELGSVFYRELCANPTAVGENNVQIVPGDSAVDMVFVVDESALLPISREILANISANIEAQLIAAGIGSGLTANRYGSVAFGHGDPAEQEIAFTDAATFAAAAASIGLVGGGLEEDAYEGIDFAIESMPWRESATVKKVIFFITDEDRNQRYYTDGADQPAQFASLKAKLVDGGFIVAGMIPTGNATQRSGDNLIVIAGDTTGKCYVADGVGGYIVKSGFQNFVPWTGSTSGTYATGIYEEYYLLILDPDIRGYFFELNANNGYQAGPPTSTSILAVIVPALTERLTNELTANLYASSTGSYLLEGYASIFRTAPMFAKDAGVISERLEFDCMVRVQDVPSNVGLRVGVSAQPADPNTDECRLVWHQRTLKKLKCQSGPTPAQHRARSSMPSDTIDWTYYHKGKVLFFELKVEGVGGDSDWSRLTSDVRRYEITRH